MRIGRIINAIFLALRFNSPFFFVVVLFTLAVWVVTSRSCSLVPGAHQGPPRSVGVSSLDGLVGAILVVAGCGFGDQLIV